MKRQMVKVLAVMAVVMLMGMTVLELSAQARVGGGRSFGSRGSRSYSTPAGPSAQQSQSRQPYAAPNAAQPRTGGGFMSGIAGGMMGGMLGSMLFSGVAGAGNTPGAASGSGIGLLEIVLLAGAGYLLYRVIRKKRADDSSLR
ncbi:MAG: hypothetical protein M0009_12120 [Deltaproteobacteria bacterium]|nr:hypothetical protein [Deltaproteobacteria bacterium]